MTPEARLTRKIMKTLKARSGWWLKIHGSASQTAGVPDIIGCYRGLFVAMEVKLPTKASTLSKMQMVQIARLLHSQAHAYVVRSTLDASKALDEIDSVLDSQGVDGDA